MTETLGRPILPVYRGNMSLRNTLSILAEEFAHAVIDAIKEMPVHELAEFHNNRTIRPKRLPAPKKAPKLARGPDGKFLPARKNARQLAPKPVAVGNA
jgi:hypothetical protein